MADFVTLQEVMLLSGKVYTGADQERVEAIIPLLCDALRTEAVKVGKDLDDMAEEDPAYANTLKLVTFDIVTRVMRQNMDGEPMAQESQAALGYSWSGTYAIPGGGIAAAIMRNDLKRLGLVKRQRIGGIELYGTNQGHNGDPDQ